MEHKFHELIKSVLGDHYSGCTKVEIDGISMTATEVEVRFLQSQFLACPDKDEFRRRVKVFDSLDNGAKELKFSDSGRFNGTFKYHLFDAASIFSVDILKYERKGKIDRDFILY